MILYVAAGYTPEHFFPMFSGRYMDKHNIFGSKRRELELSQAEVAEKVGCSRVHVSDIENRKRVPTLGLFLKFVRALQMSDDVAMKAARELCPTERA